jgi:hypothetical protein
MKYFSKLVFILLVSLFLVSCGTNKSDSRQSTDATAAASITSSMASSTAKKDTDNSKVSVTISSYYDEPKSAKDKDTIILGDASNREYVEIIIRGKIKDFELVNLEYDDSKNEVVEKERRNQIKELENKTVVIKTILAETIPSQKVKWKSEKGKVYEYVIVDNGKDSRNNAANVFNME